MAYEDDHDLRPTADGGDPLAEMQGFELRDKIGLVPILRAGLGMAEESGNDASADVWHIGLYRDEQTLKPVEYYNKLPTSQEFQFAWFRIPCWQLGIGRSNREYPQTVGRAAIKFVGLIERRKVSH
jgi:uracil phosphoribosyltransferase